MTGNEKHPAPQRSAGSPDAGRGSETSSPRRGTGQCRMRRAAAAGNRGFVVKVDGRAAPGKWVRVFSQRAGGRGGRRRQAAATRAATTEGACRWERSAKRETVRESRRSGERSDQGTYGRAADIRETGRVRQEERTAPWGGAPAPTLLLNALPPASPKLFDPTKPTASAIAGPVSAAIAARNTRRPPAGG